MTINTRKDLENYFGKYLYPNNFIKPINAQFASRYGHIDYSNIDRLLYALGIEHNDKTKMFSVDDVYRKMTQEPESVGREIVIINSSKRQNEDDIEYMPNFNQKSVDRWYRPQNTKMQITESQYKRIFENKL